MPQIHERWWGPITIDDNLHYLWRTGERLIAIKKVNRNLLIWDKLSSQEPHEKIVTSTYADDNGLKGGNLQRVIVPGADNEIVIEPSLADRFIVSKPANPITLLAGQEIQFFVGTPLWFTIMHQALDTPLLDVPFFRPSDTWFGKNTIEGKVCYATATDAKVDPNALLKHPLRCYTKITVRNRQSIPLALERLSIPVPELCVYVDAENVFWSDSVKIEQEWVNGVSVSKVESIEPNSSDERNLVSTARIKSQKTSFITSFKSLIG